MLEDKTVITKHYANHKHQQVLKSISNRSQTLHQQTLLHQQVFKSISNRSIYTDIASTDIITPTGITPTGITPTDICYNYLSVLYWVNKKT